MSSASLALRRWYLAELYPRFLDHALLHFSAQDILTSLGRRLHARFDGEVLTDCKKDRLPGARIKHRVKNNWLKMYDKSQGQSKTLTHKTQLARSAEEGSLFHRPRSCFRLVS